MRKLTHSELLRERLEPEEAKTGKKHPVIVILHNIRSLYNVGSFFRTADSAGISELIMCGFTPHPPRKEIEKTALGAVDTVIWQYFKRTQDAINYCRKSNYKIIAVELTDKKRLYTNILKDDFPMCLIFGNELTGIENDILELCDDAIEIPMYGVKHSLNVSVSAGIVIYEAINHYRSFK